MLLMAMLAIDAQATKPVWQQTDPTQTEESATPYFKGRRALIGRHCMVNELVNVVEAGSWIQDLGNLTDDDLNNSALFPSVASVGVGCKPITSVRDTKNHYAAGTKGGYAIQASSGSSLLSLDLATAFSINFYLDGVLQGTKAASTGQTAAGVGLALITIPGSSEPSFAIEAVSDWEFDEVALMPTGLASVDALTNMRLRYAFVGDMSYSTITESSMLAYAQAHDRKPFSLDQGKIYHKHDDFSDYSLYYELEGGYWAGSDLIDDDLTNGVAWGVISLGSELAMRVGATIDPTDPDQSMPFKKGATVGFKVGSASLLDLPVGSWVTIKLYKGKWVHKTSSVALHTSWWEYEQEEVQSETVSASVLQLNLINGGGQQATIIAKEDFSHVYFTFGTGLELDLGGNKGYYAFVSDPPGSTHTHHFEIGSDVRMCDTETTYDIINYDKRRDSESGELLNPISWELTSYPDDAAPVLEHITEGDNQGDARLIDMTVDGDYIITATAADGCQTQIVVTRGLDAPIPLSDEVLTNEEDASPVYQLSHQTTDDDGALINLNGTIDDEENILNESLEDYGIYHSAFRASLLENVPIIGIKKVNGLMSDGRKKRVGFVVEATSSGLDLDAIDLFQIRCYKNGTRTYWSTVEDTDILDIDLIGEDKDQKMRMAIVVPADVEFDEFELWKSGVLRLDINRFKIYYGFANDIDDDETIDPHSDPLICDSKMIGSSMGATLNANEIQFAGGVQAGTVVRDFSFFVDDDIDTYMSVSNSVSLGDGFVIAVDLGRVYGKNNQLGIIVDTKTYVARLHAGDWITMKTYLNGVEQDEQSDWDVLGVNAIGYGDKSYLMMTPKHDYDEVRITIANVVDALEFDTRYYGLYLRWDTDGDGIPDCHDENSCANEFTLDEEATVLNKDMDYPNGNLVLHRTFALNMWNDLVLPVDLSWTQVRNAFGNQVMILEPAGFYPLTEDHHGSLRFDNVLVYKPVLRTTEPAIKAGKLYMIRPVRKPDMTEGTYASQDLRDKEVKTVNAPIYFIPNVTYMRSVAQSSPIHPVADEDIPPYLLQGAPVWGAPAAAPSEDYVILHGTQVHLDGTINPKVPVGSYLYSELSEEGEIGRFFPVEGNPHELLGFRYYANSSRSLIQEHDITIVTGVVDVRTDRQNRPTGVYTIDGRKVSNGDIITELPAGIYIVNGKKMVVTH